MLSNKNYLIIHLLMIASVGFAQNFQDPFLIEYRKEALDHEQHIKMAENNVEISYRQYKMSVADLMPKVNASADYWYVQNPMMMTLPDIEQLGDLAGAELGQGANHQYGLYTSVTQPIYRGGVLKERKDKAAIKQEMSLDQLKITQLDVVQMTDLQYWKSVAQKELVHAMYSYRDDLTRIEKLVAHKVEVGTVNRSDLLMTEVRVNRANLAVIQSENDLKVFTMSLNRLLGREFESMLELSDSIVHEPPVSNVILAIDRPEYHLEEKRLLSTESDINITKGLYRPQLSAVGTGSFSSPGYNFQPGAVPNVQAGLMLSIPIYHAGKKQQMVTAAKLKRSNQELQLQRTREIHDLEIAQKRVAWENSIKETEIAQTSVAKARENAATLEERFDEGLIDILEVIDAQLYLEQAVIEYIQSKLKTKIQYTYYLRAIGHLTTN
ncbi:TolC family protein [Flammeovirga sp. SubArs3]|uniref:TolC family protein n=1 Tax=Flammeovirga sp. SubArs3 TaxID=2995316 RepID=UPI00248BFE28|nr:TolC family protein [Flammeovirga sp. SubArs3]